MKFTENYSKRSACIYRQKKISTEASKTSQTRPLDAVTITIPQTHLVTIHVVIGTTMNSREQLCSMDKSTLWYNHIVQ